MRSVDDHLADILAAVRPLPAIDLALPDALDCVLASPVDSAVDLPRFDNSSMDGYAVVASDVASASQDAPVVLPVVGDLPAGARQVPAMAQGSAVRIMTGAPVPPGAEAVVPVEWTDAGTVRVAITRPVEAGRNVRRVGEDVVRGVRLVEAGTRLTARHLGLLAATGHDRVRVHPRPRVVVMSTGSELVEPGRPLRDGQIHESNSYALVAAVTDTGAIAYRAPVVTDDARSFVDALEDQLVRADAVVTTGGVSAGAYDTVKEVLSRLGTVRFDKVAMQPGMPQGFGTVGERRQDDGSTGTPIFTLPGNPVSSYVSFEVFVRPALRKMLGESALHRPLVPAVATRGWTSPAGKRQFARVRVVHGEDGLTVEPVGGHGSHLVADLSVADALAVVPEHVTQVEAGDTVRCLLLERGRR
jgi:molybdopterin molybdotransferase